MSYLFIGFLTTTRLPVVMLAASSLLFESAATARFVYLIWEIVFAALFRIEHAS